MKRRTEQASVWRQLSSICAIALLLLAVLFIEAAYSHVPGVLPCQANVEACVIRVPDDAPTIQAAINMAQEGDIIQIAPGLYEEYLIVDKAVTLRGTAEETFIWNVWAAGPEELLPTIAVETEPGNPVTLEQLTVILPRPSWSMWGELENICLEDRPASICPDGIDIGRGANVRLHHVRVIGHKGLAFRGPQGIRVREAANATLEDTVIREIEGDGLFLGSSATATLIQAEIARNWLHGLRVAAGGRAVVRSSAVVGNGTADPCQAPDVVCSGIHIADRSRLVLHDVVVRGNTDWGLSAQLECCGFTDECRSTQVMWQDPVTVEANNTSHNHDQFGNPGNHPFKNLPDGQVCLP